MYYIYIFFQSDQKMKIGNTTTFIIVLNIVANRNFTKSLNVSFTLAVRAKKKTQEIKDYIDYCLKAVFRI